MANGWLSEGECKKRWKALNEPNTDPHQTTPVVGESIRFGGDFYQFKSLVPLFGSAFAFPLLIHFTDAFYSFASSGNAKRLLALRHFFECVAMSALKDPTSTAGKVHQQLSSKVSPCADDMNALAAEYGDIIRDFSDMSILASSDKVYRATHLESVSAALRSLAPYGLWPLIHPIRRIDDRDGGHIPTLGQLGPGRTKVVFEGADAYTRSVEASRIRMAQLRKLAEQRLLEAYKTFENGKRLLAFEGIETLEVIRLAVLELTAYGTNKEESPLIETVFPKDSPDLRLANLLTYLDAVTGGAVPGINDKEGSYGLNCLVRACGGGAFVSAHLQGSKSALFCTQLITLIDTGLNVQPCTDMAAQPIAGEFRRGTAKLMIIKATKDRPDSKEVFSAIPLEGAEALLNVPGFKLSTKAALTMWQEMSHRMRIRAEQQGNNAHRYLWISRKGTGNSGIIKKFSNTAARSQLAIFLSDIADDPILGGIEFSRQNIRPTFLSLRHAKNLNNQVVVAFANHNDSNVTFGAYINRAEYKALLASEIRKFQKRLEAAILVTDISRLLHLGIDAENIIGQAEAAVQSGLDEILFDASKEKAAAIEATPTADLAPDNLTDFLRFDPNPNDLIALWLVKRGLEAAEETFLVINPERWKRKWVPGLALVSAAVACLEQSRHKIALKRAIQAAEKGIASGELREFVPW